MAVPATRCGGRFFSMSTRSTRAIESLRAFSVSVREPVAQVSMIRISDPASISGNQAPCGIFSRLEPKKTISSAPNGPIRAQAALRRHFQTWRRKT